MKIKILLLFIFFISLLFQNQVLGKETNPIPNNKFGIHILYPEELELASKLVNSHGGDWGYVTIPIQATDKNLEKWQKFMDEALKLHLIPIIRLATYPVTNYWVKPDLYEAVDFANFLNSLDWPVKNRYIIFYNEVNNALEWGNEVNPAEYALFLNEAITIFKQKNQDFFLLNAGFDAAAPNNHVLMDEYNYLNQMEQAVPGIFSKLDGWNSHSYPNPAFSSAPWENRKNTITGYQWELDFLKNFTDKNFLVFITETGWSKERLSEEKIALYFEEAYTKIWQEDYLMAVTPFILSAGTKPFSHFSFTSESGDPTEVFKKIENLPKIAGKPIINLQPEIKNTKLENYQKIKADEEKISTLRKSLKYWLNLARSYLNLNPN